MTWRDRITVAAYTSPSGVRTEFLFENVLRETTKRTTAFDFPDADGTYIQDLGVTGRRYPFRVIFSGPDYDLQASAFEDSLSERGAGRLEHPFYGQVDVVPFGSITRRDDLKTAGNQAIIEVAWWETISIIYPVGQSDPVSSIGAGVEGYNDAMAGQFDSDIDLETVGDQSVFGPGYDALIDSTKSGLDSVADANQAVSQQFNAVFDSIDSAVDLAGDALTLAFQTMILIQAPARAQALLEDRLNAYGDLLSSIIDGPGGTPRVFDTSNGFVTSDLFASSYISGAVVSTINNVFRTKPEAITAASDLVDQLDALVIWRDDNIRALGSIDTGEAYQALLNLVSITVGYLVELAFSLQQEKRIVLDKAHTAIELTAQFYGTVDSQLDFFISSNSLTGSEILEIPAGREIVFYT